METATTVVNQEIHKHPFYNEALKRLGQVTELGFTLDPQTIQEECRRVQLLKEVEEILESKYPEIKNYPTLPRGIGNAFGNFHSLLYKELYGVYIDSSQLNKTQISIVQQWKDACRATELYKYTYEQTRSHDSYSYTVEGSVRKAIESSVRTMIRDIIGMQSDEEVTGRLQVLLNLLQGVETKKIVIPEIFPDFFAICRHVSDTKNKTSQQLLVAHARSIYKTCLGSGDLEQFYTQLVGLSDAEKEVIRREEWTALDTWMQDRLSGQ